MISAKSLSTVALLALGMVGVKASVKVGDKDGYIAVGNCSQVSVFVTPDPSIQFYQISVCWDQGAYCGQYSGYGTEDQVQQQAISGFIDTNPPCLNNASAVGPTPTYYTFSGCSNVAVFTFVNPINNIYDSATACWGNGQYCGAPGGDASSALVNFESSGAPCLVTTLPPPTYTITVGGCTDVGVYQTNYHDDPDTTVQVCWNQQCGASAMSSDPDQATQQAILNFEATNPPCLGTLTAPPALKSVKH